MQEERSNADVNNMRGKKINDNYYFFQRLKCEIMKSVNKPCMSQLLFEFIKSNKSKQNTCGKAHRRLKLQYWRKNQWTCARGREGNGIWIYDTETRDEEEVNLFLNKTLLWVLSYHLLNAILSVNTQPAHSHSLSYYIRASRKNRCIFVAIVD